MQQSRRRKQQDQLVVSLRKELPSTRLVNDSSGNMQGEEGLRKTSSRRWFMQQSRRREGCKTRIDQSHGDVQRNFCTSNDDANPIEVIGNRSQSSNWRQPQFDYFANAFLLLPHPFPPLLLLTKVDKLSRPTCHCHYQLIARKGDNVVSPEQTVTLSGFLPFYHNLP